MSMMMSAVEIRRRLGNISRQRAYSLVQRPDFPKPCAHLAIGQVWRADDVEAWIRDHRPGSDDVSPDPVPVS